MTADMLPRQGADIPFEGMLTDEEKAQLKAEARILLLAVRQLNIDLKNTRSLKEKKKLEAEAQGYLQRADELIALAEGIPTDDRYYRHDPKLLGVRRNLIKEAMEHGNAPTRASFEMGRQAFADAKRAQDTVPDARMRAAHDYDDD